MCRIMRVVTLMYNTYVNAALNMYWPIYYNSRYRVVRPWSINSLLRASFEAYNVMARAGKPGYGLHSDLMTG